MKPADWKVGLLIIVFAALVYGAYVVIGGPFAERNTYVIYAEFADVAGLTSGSRVTMAGVSIGSVSAVELVDPHTARATLTLNRKYRVPVGSVAQLPTSLLLPADMRVEILPPTKPERYVPAGGTIRGERAMSLADLLPEGTKTLHAVQESLNALTAILKDQEYETRLKSILANADATSAQIALLSDRLNRFADENEALLAQIIQDAASATSDVRTAVAHATELITDPQWKSRAEVLLDSMQDTMDRAEQVVQSVDDLVNDPVLRQNLEATMANSEQITATGVEIAATGKEIAANVEVFTDKANRLADDAAEIADEAKRLLSRLNEIVGEVPTIRAPKFAQPKITLDFLRNTDADLFRTDVYVTYPLAADSLIVGGVYDATESNKINLQYGARSGERLWTRYGLYASKPGVGVDFLLSPRLALRAELFDPNDASFNIRTLMRIGPQWGAFVGFDRLFEDNAFVFGVSLER
jgi:phospholipid/cholesterol/gamma-HCH transport system substrate-binding protein